MGTLLQDLGYGMRSLGHRPGFTPVAILTLSLGIGLNAAVFTAVDAALVRSVPYAEPDRLVHLCPGPPGQAPLRARLADGAGAAGIALFASVAGYGRAPPS